MHEVKAVPSYIAHHKVLGVIWRSSDDCVYPFYQLANGSLISADTELGENVEIGFGVIVEHSTKIGDDVNLGDFVLIGDSVTIGAGTKIDYNTTVEHECNLGARVIVSHECHIGALNDIPDDVEIGCYATIPCEVFDTDHPKEVFAALKDGWRVAVSRNSQPKVKKAHKNK